MTPTTEQGVIDAIREEHQLVAVSVGDARPTALQGGELTLTFPPDKGFQRRKAESTEGRQLIVNAVRSLTGAGVSLAFTSGELPDSGGGTAVLSEEDLVDRLRAEFDAVDDAPVGGAPEGAA